MSKNLVYGVGINDADYRVVIREELPSINGKRVRKILWSCPYYSRWANMLKRCYCKSSLDVNYTYEDSTVCEDWLTFSKFKAWMEQQEWEGNHLDKDILSDLDNKIYSPDTCTFVNQPVNQFITCRQNDRGEFLIGVLRNKRNGRFFSNFIARCSIGNGEVVHLGTFDTELEAHLAWKACKHQTACELASVQKDERVAKVLREKYSPESDCTNL